MNAALAALRRLEKRLAVVEPARVAEPEALRVEPRPAEERLRDKARAVRSTVRAWPPHFLAVRRRWERLVGEFEREGLARGLSAREAREDAELFAFEDAIHAAARGGVFVDLGRVLETDTARSFHRFYGFG